MDPGENDSMEPVNEANRLRPVVFMLILSKSFDWNQNALLQAARQAGHGLAGLSIRWWICMACGLAQPLHTSWPTDHGACGCYGISPSGAGAISRWY